MSIFDDLAPPADLRKRKQWQEMICWLKIELNSRFSLRLESREDMRHLEDMAATIINSGEIYDKAIQKQLAQCEKAVFSSDSLALRTPVFVKTPAVAIMNADDVIALYDELAAINDEIEFGDDGYVRFGSANDADQFRAIVSRMADKRNELVFGHG